MLGKGDVLLLAGCNTDSSLVELLAALSSQRGAIVLELTTEARLQGSHAFQSFGSPQLALLELLAELTDRVD
jgi:hypothetical protein